MCQSLAKPIAWFLVHVFLLFATSVNSVNYEFETVNVRTLQYRCVPYWYESCSYSWWGWRSCHSVRQERCGYETAYVGRPIRRCKTGWTGLPNCLIPVCSDACSNGQTCLSPGKCGCLHAGYGACSTVRCSNSLDCYPGTCTSAGNACQCPNGFTGANCDQFQVKPKLSSCRATLYGYNPERVIAEADCYAEDVTPTPVWVGLPSGTNTFSSIRVTWDTEVDSVLRIMPDVDYARPIQIGTTRAQCRVQISDATSPDLDAQCGVYDDGYAWLGRKSCSYTNSWRNLEVGNPSHGQTISLTATSTSGGQKKLKLPGFATETPITIYGQTASMSVKFKVDAIPPSHCLLRQSNGEGCDCFPIYLAKDITANNVIRPVMCGWSDDGSGLSRFKVDVFYLSLDQNDRLAETGDRLSISDDNVSPLNSGYYFTLPRSGVYSIQLTVFDGANNTARARKILNYDGDSKWTVNENAKVHVTQAAESTGYRWINKLDVPRGSDNYRLTVKWTGRYSSDARYTQGWGNEVVSWSGCTKESNCIDDIPPDAYRRDRKEVFFGLRTIKALPASTGILGYSLSYVVDDQDGRGLHESPSSYNPINASQDTTTISVPAENFTDGKTLVMWFVATDLAGHEEKLIVLIGLDRTSARVNDSSAEFKQNSFDPFKWSLTVPAIDYDSGIKSVSFVIYDVNLKVNVTSGIRDFEMTDKEQCGSNCYSVPAVGGWFPILLQVDVENCDFDKHTMNPLEMRYTVTNNAGLQTITKTLRLGVMEGVHCRPPPSMAGMYIAIAVGGLVFVMLVVLVVLMIWRWVVHKDPLPAGARKLYNRTFRRREADNELYTANMDLQITNLKPSGKLSIARAAAASAGDEEYGTAGDASSRVETLTARDVTATTVLAEGKFAVVKRGTAIFNSQRVSVAVKALKRGFTQSDRQLMSEKISFLSSIESHVNIVQLIGSYDGGIDGPVMVLELCEIPLKEYLDRVRQGGLSTDNLDDMLLFVANIASGVQHLHSRSIVHGRLGVRNVLLKQQLSGYVAKLTGFGPTAAEEGGLPLRWLPLETHNTRNTSNPTINYKTDAWSFGITVWEIYSKGDKPYPHINKAGEVHGLLKRGHRMDRPEDCPPELWNQVVVPCWNDKPNSRPSFNTICNTITQFRNSHSANSGQDVYYTSDQGDGQELYCNT